MFNYKNPIIRTLLLVAALVSVQAMGQGSTSGSVERENQYGVNLGIGDPFPGLIGVNGAYNINKDLRITAGYAEVEITSSISFTESGLATETIKAQTYGLGAQYLFTGWSVRPTAGAHLGYFNVSGEGEFSINGFDKSTTHMYTNLGFDWIGQSGVHSAVGMNVAVLGGSGSGFYANLGYFF